MHNFIKNFRNDEDGAVTVDFVVLTAAIVLLGLAVGAAIQNGARTLANDIEDALAHVDRLAPDALICLSVNPSDELLLRHASQRGLRCLVASLAPRHITRGVDLLLRSARESFSAQFQTVRNQR